jgi:Mrp family chromosome partitioning ATPase
MIASAAPRPEPSRTASATRSLSSVPPPHPGGFYLPLVGKLAAQAENGDTGAAFVFTSASPREGVSTVAHAAACELSAATGEKVLLADSRHINCFAPTGAAAHGPVASEGNGVYRLRASVPAPGAAAVPRFELLAQLQHMFPYVLIDCPAMESSAEALEYATRSSGIVLVAAAGVVRRSRLLQARRAIELSRVPLLGCALNQRTYPIPEFLFRWL